MKVIKDINEWRHVRSELTDSIGFVPTMGNLHRGHQSLLEHSLSEKSITVASIFVNRTQFNNPADFNNYPKTIDDDLTLLETLGVDYCLCPNDKELYPDNYRYQVTETVLSNRLEGLHRPGHFEGVLTVVLKLLMLVQAQCAYFGEKDYQQYQLIASMAESFFIPTKIHCCPTIRESGKLALSSRNNRLNEQEKKQAETFARIFHQGGDVEKIKKSLEQEKITVEYIEDYQGRRFAAVFIGEVRLIDNYAF